MAHKGGASPHRLVCVLSDGEELLVKVIVVQLFSAVPGWQEQSQREQQEPLEGPHLRFPLPASCGCPSRWRGELGRGSTRKLRHWPVSPGSLETASLRGDGGIKGTLSILYYMYVWTGGGEYCICSK
jgi:hypothetical protein